MSTHQHIDRICCGILALTLLLTVLFMNGGALGLTALAGSMGYENRLFDTDRVHTIDIVMDDWDGFIADCENEEYVSCTLVIDGERYNNVAFRAKGNTSLSSVSSLGSDRYSFKVEFDHYDETQTYYGLDKLSLNNLIQDNTMMKDYLTYQMMNAFGVDSSLCSFAYLRVNGEDWGLYLAVEGVEEAFLQRNYGSPDAGDLYKPDSMNFNGGGGGMNSGSATLEYTDDDPDSYSVIFSSAVTDVTEEDQTRLIAALKALNEQTDLESVLNVEEVLRYFVVHNYVVNGDSYTGSMIHNYYLYEEDGRLSMIPWDYNLAFGTFQGNNASDAVNDPIDTPLNASQRPMWAWIGDSTAYLEQYHALFQAFLDTVDPAAIVAQAYDLIAPYVETDPTKFCTYDEFETGVQALTTFCTLRTESVRGQLEGTIPATDDGQKADSSTLVDTGSLTLSDLGTMGNTMGGGGGFPGGEMPDFGEMPDMSSFDPSTLFQASSDPAGQADVQRTASTTTAASDSGAGSASVASGGGVAELSDVVPDTLSQAGSAPTEQAEVQRTASTTTAASDSGAGSASVASGGGVADMGEMPDFGDMPDMSSFDPSSLAQGDEMPTPASGEMPDPAVNLSAEDQDQTAMPAWNGASDAVYSDGADTQPTNPIYSQNADTQPTSGVYTKDSDTRPMGGGFSGGEMPDMGDMPGGGGFPGQESTAEETVNPKEALILLGASVGSLLLGLAIALKTKH